MSLNFYSSFIEDIKLQCTGAVRKRFPQSSENFRAFGTSDRRGKGKKKTPNTTLNNPKTRFSLFCIWGALSPSLGEKLTERKS